MKKGLAYPGDKWLKVVQTYRLWPRRMDPSTPGRNIPNPVSRLESSEMCSSSSAAF